jgi:hypothetical protein
MARQKAKKKASKQIRSRKKRSIFSYPLFLFLLLCSGVFLIAWTFRANADVLVTAKVSAPFVTQPAVITSPSDGTHFSLIPITVSGTCPANAGYVEIFDNNVMRGTAICDTSSNFQLSVDLFPGTNSLVAHVFNITDDEGPVSSAVTVYYDVPQPPAGNPTAAPRSPSHGSPSLPVLKTAFIYRGYHIGQAVEWPLELSGGLPPYAVSVDWGDGTSDLISRSQPGQFNINHTYSQPGDTKNSFTIKVKASDANGNSAYLQFFVIVTPQSIGAAGNIFTKSPPHLSSGLNWLWIAWPLYVVILLMAVSYLLGEREELVILRKKGMLRH